MERISKKMSREARRIDLLRLAKPLEYTKQFLTEQGITLLPDGSLRDTDGKNVPASDMMGNLRLANCEDRMQMRVLCANLKLPLPEKIAKEDLGDALDKLIREAITTALATTNEIIKYDGRDAAELQCFVKALTGTEGELALGALQHWLSNVKRKMLGLPVQYHMFPVLVGKQGGGKTTALKKLLEPLQWYTMSLSSVQALADERNFRAIADKYVAVFDEMARADKTDAQILKNIITSDVVSARVLGTNRRDKLVMNCSFIGTTNTALTSLIYDPSGMRRFFEVRCQDALDWAAINAVDYVAALRSIDPEREYLKPMREALAAHQEEIREPSQIEQFIDEEGLTPGEVNVEADRMSSGRLYEMYRGWAERSGHKSTIPVNRLSKELGLLKFPKWRNKRVRGMWVKVSEATHLLDASFAEQGLADLDAIDGKSMLIAGKKHA